MAAGIFNHILSQIKQKVKKIKQLRTHSMHKVIRKSILAQKQIRPNQCCWVGISKTNKKFRWFVGCSGSLWVVG